MSDTQITLDNLYAKSKQLPAGEVIVDVRRPEEFAEAHIDHALNIPVDQVAQRADELKKYQHVYLHCKRGGRAKTAFDLLTAAGLKNVVCVYDAGMDAWLERGYPAVKG